MADNLKPYNPNKGPISIRLNPDAIKEEALNLIPYPFGTIAREMYYNPDGSAIETAKQVGREFPVLGSLLSGEPVNALKEAILLGAPVKLNSSLNKVKNSKSRNYYVDSHGDLWQSRNKLGMERLTSRNELVNGLNPKNLNAVSRLNKNEAIKYLEDSKNASQFVIDHDIKATTEVNPFERNYIKNQDPATRAMREDAEKLIAREDAINKFKDLDDLANAYNNSLNDKKWDGTRWFNKGEELHWLPEDMPYNRHEPVLISYKPGGNTVAEVTTSPFNEGKASSMGREKLSEYYPAPLKRTDPIKYKPYINKDLDQRMLNEDAALYNIKYDLNDNFINYISRDQYLNDMDAASQAYRNAIHGPYMEDIFINQIRGNEGDYIRELLKSGEF